MDKRHYLFQALRLSPAAVRSVVSAVPTSRHDDALEPGRFSLRFALAHLVDWEPIMLGRIRQCVEEPGSTVYGIDEGERAVAEHYEAWGVPATLDRFDKERAKLVEYCSSLSDAQWDSVAVHNERGPMSAQDWAWTVAGHDMYHLEQFAAYLR